MVTFNFTEEFLRQAKRLAKRYHSLADDIDALQHELMENPYWNLPWRWKTQNQTWCSE